MGPAMYCPKSITRTPSSAPAVARRIIDLLSLKGVAMRSSKRAGFALGIVLAATMFFLGVPGGRGTAQATNSHGGCPFCPTSSWNGSIPNGCLSNIYLIFPGAMKYIGGGGFCQWVFLSIASPGDQINTCSFAAAMTALGNDLANLYPGANC
jgi:hypothetical protein